MHMNTTNRTIYKVICCAYFVAGSVCAMTVPARADDAGLPTKTVKYGDLNLSSPAGVKVLYRRIQAAAYDVCPVAIVGDVRQMTAERTCVNKAIDGAIHQVDLAALTDLRYGGQVRLASK
jgi:UrcA family protein